MISKGIKYLNYKWPHWKYKIIYWSKAIQIYYKIPKQSQLYVFDIDNTLADARNAVVDFSVEEGQRMLNYRPLKGMINWIKTNINTNEGFSLFLSARNPVYINETHEWLLKQGLLSSQSAIILVISPSEKLNYLRFFLKRTKKILYVDDLSFNDEKGNLLFYNDLISKIKNLPIEFKDYNFISAQNNVYEF